MPVIQRFRTPEAIDSRVQSGSISNAGTSAIGRTIESLGGQGVALGVQLLQRRKEAKARKFTSDSLRSKRVEADRFYRELRQGTDPATGITGTGEDFTEAYTKFEDELTKSLIGNAPTGRAEQLFLQSDRPATNGRIIKADRDKHTAIAREGLRSQFNNVDDSRKFLLDYTPEFEEDLSISDKTKEELAAVNQETIGSIGSVHTPESAQIFIDQANSKIAEAGIDSMLIHDKVGEAARAIGMFSLFKQNPEFKLQLEKEARETGLIEEDEFLETTLDGKPVRFNKKTGIFTDLKTGEAVARGEVLAQKPIEGEVINVGAEIPTLVPYITPEYQKSTALKLIRKYGTGKKESTKALVDSARGMSTLLVSDTANNKMRARQGSEEEKQYFSKVDEILNSSLDPVNQNKLIGELVSSKLLGEYRDSNNFAHRGKARREIKNLPNKIREEYEKLGLPADKLALANTIQSAVKAAETNLNSETKALISNSSEYHNSKSRGFSKKFSQIDSSLIGQDSRQKALADNVKVESYVRSLKASSSSMGIPNYITEQGLFTDNHVGTKVAAFSDALAKGTQDGYKSAVAWMRNNQARYGKYYPILVDKMEKNGLNKYMQHVLFTQDNVEGNKLAATLMRNAANFEAIKEGFSKTGTQMSKLRKEIASNSAAVLSTFTSNSLVPSVGQSKQNSMFAAIELEAMRLMSSPNSSFGSGSPKNAAQQAHKNVVEANMKIYSIGNSNVAIYKSTLVEAGLLNSDLPKKAFSAFQDPDILKKYIDVEASIPNVVRKTLDGLGLKGEARKKKAMELAIRGGDFRVTEEDGKVVVFYRSKASQQNVKVMSKDDNTEVFSIPLEELRLNPDVQGRSLFDMIFGQNNRDSGFIKRAPTGEGI